MAVKIEGTEQKEAHEKIQANLEAMDSLLEQCIKLADKHGVLFDVSTINFRNTYVPKAVVEKCEAAHKANEDESYIIVELPDGSEIYLDLYSSAGWQASGC